MKRILLMVLVLKGCMVLGQEAKGTVIVLEITNIESDEGTMRIGLYDSAANWLKKTLRSHTAQIENGKCAVNFENVPDGTFAISSYHDKNNNGDLDTNFLGIPKESTGSSNNAPARFGPPKWEEAKFKVEGKSIKQTIKL